MQEEFTAVIRVDAVPRGEPPGTVYLIEPDLSSLQASAGQDDRTCGRCYGARRCGYVRAVSGTLYSHQQNVEPCMHELSIAMAIVDAAVEESERRGGARVTQVHIKLGQLAGVVKSALLASYEMAAEQSSVAGSKLVIDEVPILVFCPVCQDSRSVVSMTEIRCSDCGTPTPQIIAGRELEVVAMEIIE